jgi:ABC-type amino acid transport substrate-binding protein
VAAVHTLAIATLGGCAVGGALAVNPRKLMRFAVVTGLLAAAIVGGTRIVLAVALAGTYTNGAVMANMGMLRQRQAATVLVGQVSPMPPVTSSVLDRVRTSGKLRIGYFDDSLPYAFFNSRGELVGLDVEMALQLAADLNVHAEFVRVDRAVLDTTLDATLCDVIMSGVAVTADRALHVRFSASYLDETLAFIVPDKRMMAFSDWSRIRAMGPLRIGVPRASYFIEKVRDELGDAEIVPIDRMDDVFGAQRPPFDAVMGTAERGSAYTLLHPEYSVAVPKPRPFKIPLAYVIADRDAAMTSVVDLWIELKRKDGMLDALFAHWILGRDAAPERRRWSILDDVLRSGVQP